MDGGQKNPLGQRALIKKHLTVMISEIGRSLHTAHIICDVGLNNQRAYCTRRGLSPAGETAKKLWLRTGCPEVGAPTLHIDALAGARKVASGCLTRVGNRVLHPSHTLVCFRGLYICAICAHYSGSRVVELGNICSGVCTAHGQCMLDLIQAGKLPYGLSRWPDGTGLGTTITLAPPTMNRLAASDRLRAVYARVAAKQRHARH